MREIKVRAWDRKKKEWATGGEYHWLALSIESGEIFFVHHGGQVEDTELYPTESIVLMQFTGLKDKNGKEIYEGDIVHLTKGFSIGDGEDFIEGKIEYFLPYAGFGISGIGFDQLSLFPMKVIGNIYENPELLGGASNHVNPNCQDSARCKPHGETGPVKHKEGGQ